MLAQANALAKDRKSGQGQLQWKRRVCKWQWRVQPRRRGSRRNCGGKKHPQLAFRSSFMNCRSALHELRGVA